MVETMFRKRMRRLSARLPIVLLAVLSAVGCASAQPAPPAATATPVRATNTPVPGPSATATPVPPATATVAPGGFDPRAYLGQGDAYGCHSFASQAQAQAVLRADPSDPNKLDTNPKDGKACGGLEASADGVAGGMMPGPYDNVPVPRSQSLLFQPGSGG